MARDGSSGGVIRLVTIDKSGVSREFIPGKEGGGERGLVRVNEWIWESVEGGREGGREGGEGGCQPLTFRFHKHRGQATLRPLGAGRECVDRGGREGGREGGTAEGRAKGRRG
jgi:hypothetical protein